MIMKFLDTLGGGMAKDKVLCMTCFVGKWEGTLSTPSMCWFDSANANRGSDILRFVLLAFCNMGSAEYRVCEHIRCTV